MQELPFRVGSNKAQEQAAPSGDADTGLGVVSVNPLAELANTYWKLISLNETAIVMAEEQTREAFLQLRDDTKSVKGFADRPIRSGVLQLLFRTAKLDQGDIQCASHFC